jgi:hypothetical protein
MSMESHDGMILTGKIGRTRRKICPKCQFFSATYQSWTDPGLDGERSATNRLSHGTALVSRHAYCVCNMFMVMV